MHAALAIANDLVRTCRVSTRRKLTIEFVTLMTAALGVGCRDWRHLFPVLPHRGITGPT